MNDFDPTRAERFAALDDASAARWWALHDADRTIYPTLLGIEIEDIRVDYCRMRLPFSDDLLQKAGFVHGGAFASLLDHVVVPAVGVGIGADDDFATVDMHVQYIRGIGGGERAEDALAEGWVTRRGRRTVFCEAEIFGATSGRLLAKGVLTYAVSPRRTTG